MQPGSGALISECGKYRYQLWRKWSDSPSVYWVMLNPSVADAGIDDPTIRRCIRFSKEWGGGGIVVLNLFALRATDPQQLKKVPDPVGPKNDRCLSHISDEGILVAAWGSNGSWWGRSAEVLSQLQLRHTVFCLGYCSNGEPRHPLMLAADTALEVMEGRL